MPPVPKPTRKPRGYKREVIKELIPLEETEQKTVIDWLVAHRLRHTAIVPDRKMCKQLGYSPGVPDIIIFDRPTVKLADGREYIGCAIEMKRREGGKLSSEQREWLYALHDIGWAAFSAKGCDEAIAGLEKLYGRK